MDMPQGHYGIGNWWLCPNVYPALHGTKLGPLPQRCRDAQVHSDQGIFGFWPVWDRRLGYWMLFAVGGIPVISDGKSELLQLSLKPFIDKAVNSLRSGPSADWADLADSPSSIDWEQLAAKFHSQLPAPVLV